MPADVQAIMDAAEQAAASNDYPSAARLLREAAALQERSLGPLHPDLANTLNNLGVMFERTGEIDESERCFRRAYAIATVALPSDHPFVATSRENLEEFCRLHGRSFEDQVESREQDVIAEEGFKSESAAQQDEAVAEDAIAEPHQQDPVYGAGSKDPAHIVDPAYTALRSSSALEQPRRGVPFGLVAVGVIAVVLVSGLGWMAWRSGDTTRRVDTTPPREISNPTPVLPDAPTPATPPHDAPTPPTAAPSPVDPTPASPPTPAAAAPTSTDSPTVADARLCRTLTTSGAWQCDAISGDVAPGPIYFFTRVVAERPTTVQHRWYVGDQLRQSVMLSIQPNGAGYRTYSRTTIAPERAGQWRVEVRSEDGRLLREERFTVR